ncbi:ADP-ribosylglycohydrolase-domain-containing protein [Gigaspora rosea]|uniref:ADP-ribosylglycohydrolase-domain-containing protein n=1 Tax=Gigaspora rosea TaxID=44941 RepID=A0A397UV12_9GLOM|nr:ADP-ribosylglycohydrolase-domain-containing protein [Gigaspora rosea]
MTWTENASKLSNDEIYDKLKGCIFGAALGDAVGLATEFMSKEKAKKLYGIGPISFGSDKGYKFYVDRQREKWFTGEWTDDTDQQLLIIDSLICSNGIFNTKDFANRLSKWNDDGYPELDNKPPNGIGKTVGSVLRHSKFKKQPHRAAWDIWVQFNCNMAANGALMRTAILGFPFFWDEKQVIKQTLQATKATHADPRCCVSSVIVTILISRLIQGNIQETIPDLDDSTKQNILSWIQSGNPDKKIDNDIDNDELPQNNELSKRKSFVKRAVNKVGNFLSDQNDRESLWHERQKKISASLNSSNQNREIPVIPDPLPPGMDTYGVDPEMLALTKSVIDRYKFMINAASFEKFEKVEFKKGSRFSKFQTDMSETALLQHCFPDTLAALKLDEYPSIGYVYKCLGAGLYCFTRNLSQQSSEGDAFKKIITELVLEAGDADTNAAVAGALLGTRIGYNKLPKEWLEGLQFKDWLEKRTDSLWAILSSKEQK